MPVVHPAACRQRSGQVLTSANTLWRDSSLELLCSVVASVAVYDFIFYWVHLALHKVPWLLRNVHAVHHRQVQLSAREVVHHSLSDGTLQVGANVLALKLLGLHPLARAAHNVVVTYLLTESHAGYDMPWMLHNVVPCGILGGPPRHAAHHKYGTLHYHQVRDWFSHTFICFSRRSLKESQTQQSLTRNVGLSVFYVHRPLVRSRNRARAAKFASETVYRLCPGRSDTVMKQAIVHAHSSVCWKSFPNVAVARCSKKGPISTNTAFRKPVSGALPAGRGYNDSDCRRRGGRRRTRPSPRTSNPIRLLSPM